MIARKAFLNSSVRFTLSVRTIDHVDVDLAWAVLCRGAAIVCRDVQEAVDLVIQVVFNRDNRMVKEEITTIFVRCKLQSRGPPNTVDADPDSTQSFRSGQLPYITITMDLREDEDETEYPAQPVWRPRETSIHSSRFTHGAPS